MSKQSPDLPSSSSEKELFPELIQLRLGVGKWQPTISAASICTHSPPLGIAHIQHGSSANVSQTTGQLSQRLTAPLSPCPYQQNSQSYPSFLLASRCHGEPEVRRTSRLPPIFLGSFHEQTASKILIHCLRWSVVDDQQRHVRLVVARPPGSSEGGPSRNTVRR